MRNVIRIMLILAFLSPVMPAAARTPTDLLGSTPTAAVADAPVTLSDATSFEAPLTSEVAAAEIAAARQELASAVSAEKFLNGAVTVVAAAILLVIAF